jgi:hypothetical protein
VLALHSQDLNQGSIVCRQRNRPAGLQARFDTNQARRLLNTESRRLALREASGQYRTDACLLGRSWRRDPAKEGTTGAEKGRVRHGLRIEQKVPDSGHRRVAGGRTCEGNMAINAGRMTATRGRPWRDPGQRGAHQELEVEDEAADGGDLEVRSDGRNRRRGRGAWRRSCTAPGLFSSAKLTREM